MPTVMIADFSGMLPLRDPLLLPDNNAQNAVNTWLYTGKVRGFRYGNPVHNLQYTDTQLVYRIPLNDVNPPDFSDTGSLWLEYPDPYMATIKSPTVGDTFNRYYFFPSDQIHAVDNNTWRGGPQYATLSMLTPGSTRAVPYILGVPPPLTAPTVTPPATNATHTAVASVPAQPDATISTPPGAVNLWLDSVANLLPGMLVSDERDVSLTQVAVAPVINLATTAAFTTASPGITMVANPGTVVPGMTVYDTTTSQQIGTVSSYLGTSLVLTANAAQAGAAGDILQFTDAAVSSPAGTTMLYFASVGTAGTSNRIRPGMLCKSLSNPAGIFSQASVVSVDSTKTPNEVVINYAILLDVEINDTIQFDNVNQIPANTTIVTNGVNASLNVVELSAAVVCAGVWVGDPIQFATDVPEERSYVYTWVTHYDEEGPPSPYTTAVGDPTGAWTITIPALDAGTAANRAIEGFRLYRTVTDSQGNATYYEVNPDGFLGPSFNNGYTYIDTSLDADITSNKTLDSVSYTPPPADLQGVVMMANGIAAGWSNQREIWFSAAYLPHAWPEAYALTVDYPVVGLTADGSSLNIITEGPPFIATGVTPDTMTLGKITANEPCIGRGSIIAAGEGAYYASPNGMILLNSSGTTNVTLKLFEKEFLYSMNPWNFAGARYGSSMTIFFKNAPPTAGHNGAVIDFSDPNVPFAFIGVIAQPVNAYSDELSGQVFYLANVLPGAPNGAVVQWNPPVGNPGTTQLWGYLWRTKRFRFTFPQQLKAFMVLFDVPPEVTFTLGSRNTDPNMVYNPATQYLIVRVYVGGILITTREVQQSGETLLINGGFKATIWEFQFEGIVDLRFFKAASSVHDLKTA